MSTPTASAGVSSFAAVARIAWRRARTFNPLAAHLRTSRAGALLAPALWPVLLPAVARQAPRIRHLGTASLTLDDKRPQPGSAALVAAAAATAVAVLVGFLAVGTALTIAVTPALGWSPTPMLTGWMALLMLPLMAQTAWILLRLRNPQARQIEAWRAQLEHDTGHRTYLMTNVLRAPGAEHRGEGQQLLIALQREWMAQGDQVVLMAANQAVASWYERLGARCVTSGGLRLEFNTRPQLFDHG